MDNSVPGNQANIEYFFRKLYELLFGGSVTINYAAFLAFLAALWLWVTVIGYIIAVAGLFLIVYCMVRLFELREREEHFYSTLIAAPAHARVGNSRWQHIESLLGSGDASKWREAILEADIMLNDALFRRGYEGENVSDKLKNADAANFRALNDAWEAHKVRNQIAHEGSAFHLTETIARRTIARFETALRELGAL
ncbi:MAG TPA: hypothetical protein VFP46_00335 [Candidatus Paceibacterota bacterium]|nr:hypothetical protein [Candidatus Paceibacterota bacterium]